MHGYKPQAATLELLNLVCFMALFFPLNCPVLAFRKAGSFSSHAFLIPVLFCFGLPPPMSSSSLLLCDLYPALIFMLTSPWPCAAKFVFLSDPLGRALFFAHRPGPAVSLRPRRSFLIPRLPRRPGVQHAVV